MTQRTAELIAAALAFVKADKALDAAVGPLKEWSSEQTAWEEALAALRLAADRYGCACSDAARAKHGCTCHREA